MERFPLAAVNTHQNHMILADGNLGTRSKSNSLSQDTRLPRLPGQFAGLEVFASTDKTDKITQ